MLISLARVAPARAGRAHGAVEGGCAVPLVSLPAQNLDIEAFGSLDPTKTERARTSIKPRCIGL